MGLHTPTKRSDRIFFSLDARKISQVITTTRLCLLNQGSVMQWPSSLTHQSFLINRLQTQGHCLSYASLRDMPHGCPYPQGLSLYHSWLMFLIPEHRIGMIRVSQLGSLSSPLISVHESIVFYCLLCAVRTHSHCGLLYSCLIGLTTYLKKGEKIGIHHVLLVRVTQGHLSLSWLRALATMFRYSLSHH